MNFLKKNYSTLIILALVALLFIPQTGMPIKVFFNRLIAFSPSEINPEDQVQVKNYEWSLEPINGEITNFSDAEGKVVVVNIWATWCPPCVAEMPSMQALYDGYGNTVKFYFVSLESAATIQRFMSKKGYTFPAYSTTHTFPTALETKTFPTTYIISKDGKIVMDKKGAADWNSEIVHKTLDVLLAK